MESNKSERKLVKVSTVPGLLSADMIRIFLESRGIQCLVSQESAGRTLGLTIDGLGTARVYVPEDQAKEAEELLEALERGEFTLPEEKKNDSQQDQNE